MFTLMKVHRAAVAVASTIAVVGGVAVVATAAPAAAAAPVALAIVQHNTDQTKARWNRVVTMMESGKWDAATVQEVCVGWMQDLRAAHPGWSIAYHPQVAKGDCAGGEKGNVAIHPGNGSEFNQAFGVEGEGKNFGMACSVFSKGGFRVHACSTHFTVDDPNPEAVRLRQAGRVKDWARGWLGLGAEHAVVVGGDLNTGPKTTELNPIYKNPAASSHGDFNEAEQLRLGTTERAGRDTVSGRKIDYVFFSANHTPLSAGGTLTFEEPTPGAHKILKATTTLR